MINKNVEKILKKSFTSSIDEVERYILKKAPFERRGINL